jgi:hypothetical protein
MVDKSILTVGPKADESIHSMILRLAPLFMVTVSDFVRFALNVAGAIHIAATRIEALWRMAELAGWDAADIEHRKIEPTSAGMMIYQREVPHEWIDLRARRIAPGVLASDEIPYHRMPWHANPIECDLSNGEVLIDRCPKCDASLGWSNIETVFACGACEFDLRGHSPTYVPADRLLLARELHAYLNGTAGRLPSDIEALDDVSRAYAMEWLAFFVDLPVGRRLKPSCNNAPFGLVEAKRWPKGFDDVMTRFVSSAPLVPGLASKAQMVSQLIEAIQRAGTPPLRQLFLDRAIRVLNESPLSEVAASNRVFRQQRDIRASEGARSYSMSMGEFLRIDSMRAIQSATSRRPVGS